MKKKILILIATLIMSFTLIIGTTSVNAASMDNLIYVNSKIPQDANYALFGNSSINMYRGFENLNGPGSSFTYYEFTTQAFVDNTGAELTQGYTYLDGTTYITYAQSRNRNDMYVFPSTDSVATFKNYQFYRLLDCNGFHYNKFGYILPWKEYEENLKYSFIRFEENDTFQEGKFEYFENYTYSYTIEVLNYDKIDSIYFTDGGNITAKASFLATGLTVGLSLADILPMEELKEHVFENNLYIKRFQFSISLPNTIEDRQDILFYMPNTNLNTINYLTLNINTWTDNIIFPEENPFAYVLLMVEQFLNMEIFPGFHLWYTLAFAIGSILIAMTIKMLR